MPLGHISNTRAPLFPLPKLAARVVPVLPHVGREGWAAGGSSVPAAGRAGGGLSEPELDGAEWLGLE